MGAAVDVGQQRDAILAQDRRMQRHPSVGRVQRLPAPAGLAIDRPVGSHEARDIRDRVVHDVAAPAPFEVQGLVEVHRPGRIDRDERELAPVGRPAAASRRPRHPPRRARRRGSRRAGPVRCGGRRARRRARPARPKGRRGSGGRACAQPRRGAQLDSSGAHSPLQLLPPHPPRRSRRRRGDQPPPARARRLHPPPGAGRLRVAADRPPRQGADRGDHPRGDDRGGRARGALPGPAAA